MEAPEAPSPSPACEPVPVSPPVRPDDVPVLIRPAGRISSGEAIAMEATLAELSWQHQEGAFLLPPAAPLGRSNSG
jgi:hypothetical protein